MCLESCDYERVACGSLSLRPAQSALASAGTASYKVRLHLKPLKKKKRKEEGEEKEEEEGHKMKRRKEGGRRRKDILL